MPFVKRDSEGAVLALYRERAEDAQEYLEPHDPEVADFLPTDEIADPADPFSARKRELTETDFALIRAIEDVVNLLLEKRIFAEADLPEALLELLERRNKLRSLIREIVAR